MKEGLEKVRPLDLSWSAINGGREADGEVLERPKVFEENDNGGFIFISQSLGWGWAHNSGPDMKAGLLSSFLLYLGLRK